MFESPTVVSVILLVVYDNTLEISTTLIILLPNNVTFPFIVVSFVVNDSFTFNDPFTFNFECTGGITVGLVIPGPIQTFP